MDNICYERYYKARITDTMLDEAAQLFSEHYGVWTENAGPVLAGSTKAGESDGGSPLLVIYVLELSVAASQYVLSKSS